MKSLNKLFSVLLFSISLLFTLNFSSSAQELIKVGTFVPEKSVGVSRVIQPFLLFSELLLLNHLCLHN